MSWNSSGRGQIARKKKKWCLWPAPQLSHRSELSYFVNYIALYSKLIPGLSLTSAILWMPSHDYSNGWFMYRVVSCPVTRSISRTIAPLLYRCELCAWHSVLQVGCVGYSGGMLIICYLLQPLYSCSFCGNHWLWYCSVTQGHADMFANQMQTFIGILKRAEVIFDWHLWQIALMLLDSVSQYKAIY